ncbi:MAG: signal transduction histidine kinase, partial [Phenylobacterium sp.]
LIGHYQPDSECIVINLSIESGKQLPIFFISMDEVERPAVWCVRHQKPLIMNDIERDYSAVFGDVTMPAAIMGQATTNSLMYWPLMVSGHIIGVLSVQSKHKHAYQQEHQDIIQTLVPTLAIALDNANAYRKIEEKHQEIEIQHNELVATQQQLVQAEKMASLGTLTAGVAHEINNPTNFVHVSAQNLAVDLSKFQQFLFNVAGEDADEEILNSFKARIAPLHMHLDTIQNGTGRIKTIVQDLRAFSQLDSAAKKTECVTDLLLSTVHLIRTNYLESAEFITEFHATPQLLCYPAQLNQVFMNLIVNACDAIRDKQRTNGSRARGIVTISCRQLDQHIEITVKDNGCGMSEETKNKLFEPFYTTKDVGEGTGLGLSISFGIIQKHQGQLSAESKLGIGSVFSVLLPMADEA